VDRTTISRLYEKFLETGTVEDAPRSGRPLVLEEEEKKKAVQELDQQHEKSVNFIASQKILWIGMQKAQICFSKYPIKYQN